MNKFEVHFCSSEDAKTFQEIVQLRYIILRSPWGKPIESVFDADESMFYNAYIRSAEGKIIACGRLQFEEKMGQIRFMAVSNQAQGKGLGTIIVEALETKAKELGLNKIILHARENALGFYDNLNYRLVRPSYKLWDIIQHYEMEKEI